MIDSIKTNLVWNLFNACVTNFRNYVAVDKFLEMKCFDMFRLICTQQALDDATRR